jgi:nitrous oxidase accessory protein NosD
MQRLNIQTHPELRTLSFAARPIVYTRHAKERALAKNVTLGKSLHINPGDIVELEIVGDRASKIVVRQSMTTSVDRVMVLVPNGDGWACVTVWTNKKTDTHATLNLARISA